MKMKLSVWSRIVCIRYKCLAQVQVLFVKKKTKTKMHLIVKIFSASSNVLTTEHTDFDEIWHKCSFQKIFDTFFYSNRWYWRGENYPQISWKLLNIVYIIIIDTFLCKLIKLVLSNDEFNGVREHFAGKTILFEQYI